VASVIGRIIEFDLLAQAHPARPDGAALTEQMNALTTRDFTRLEMPSPRLAYMFKHNITQEVAYETLLEAQQRELHQAVGATLERLQPEAVEQLAFHYSRAGVRRKMVLYLDKAARKAQYEYANETALNYYSQALAVGERWEWRKGQVEVWHTLGRREEEAAGLRALKDNPSVPVFEVNYLWGQYLEVIGDYAQARALIERAMADCRERADVLGEVRCLTYLGLVARRQGDYDNAKSWYTQALTSFQGEATYSDEEAQALAQALNGLGIAHRQQGNFDEAKKCYEQALALARESGNRQAEAEVLNSLGVTAFYQRNFVEALPYYEQALELRRAIGDRVGEGASLYDLATAILEAGD
ncbi:MAG: tetratricopeptide repeat protein, partial [Acidobacteria bacterium]|nr:tetratricopeptide repeat protein [Acidobacteriota bacterium]